MTPGRPHLSVVIPAFNEEKRLEQSFPKIEDYLNRRDIDAEVIVVDDGSGDRTAEVGRGSGLGDRLRVLVNSENRGKGFSLRRGLLEARGSWVLFTDADLSAPIEEHEKLERTIRDHDLDVAIGSRGVAAAKIEIRQSQVRELMGKTFNRIIRLATGLPFRDTQCGFKLLARERVRPLFERMIVDHFACDVELLFLCDRYGLSVREVPVVWRNDPRSTVGMFRDPPRMLIDVARVRWRFRRGGYNP